LYQKYATKGVPKISGSKIEYLNLAHALVVRSDSTPAGCARLTIAYKLLEAM
jgi:hypothetical protein